MTGKSGYIIYLAVVINVVLCVHSVTTNQPGNVMLLHDRASSLTLPIVPSPRDASGRESQNTGHTGGPSVQSITTCVETVVPTEDPLGASAYTTLGPGHDKSAGENTPGSVSALPKKVISNFHAHLIALSSLSHLQLHPREWASSIPFIDRVAQIPNDLACHAANASSVVKHYYISGHNSLVTFITAAQSAMISALNVWNGRMDQIAIKEGWGDLRPQPQPTLPQNESISETGLLSGTETGLALREKQSLYRYVASTAQRTMLLFGRIAQRKARNWEVVVVETVARIGMKAWHEMVNVAVALMAFLTILVLLGLIAVLMWWWRAAVWLWRQIW